MKMKTDYYRGQGKLFIAKYNKDGSLEPERWLGNVPKLSLDTKVQTKKHKESHSGSSTTDKVIEESKEVVAKFTLEEITAENLALAFQGDVKVVKGAKVTDESIKTIAKGENYRLKQQNVSNVVIHDNNDQPLVENQDYLLNAKHGRITYISESDSLQMPLKVSYDHADNTIIEFLSSAKGEYQLVFEGLNTAENNEPLTVIVHKIALDPASSFDLINDDFNSFELSGEALSSDKGLVTIIK